SFARSQILASIRSQSVGSRILCRQGARNCWNRFLAPNYCFRHASTAWLQECFSSLPMIISKCFLVLSLVFRFSFQALWLPFRVISRASFRCRAFLGQAF